jgi:hypothetical protein
MRNAGQPVVVACHCFCTAQSDRLRSLQPKGLPTRSLLAALLTTTFAFAPAAFAQETKRLGAEECKKEPKMKSCETMEEKKVEGGC